MLNIRLGRYASKGCKRLIGEDLKENHCLIKKNPQNVIDSKTNLQYFVALSEVLNSVSQHYETMLAL